jgi:two-component system, response regulator PdtaR
MEGQAVAQNITVLVVEDEALPRLAIADFLKGDGFEVFEAGNAAEAIAVLEANSDIHILFTDIDMPGSMDGLKLSEFVRDRWPPVRIVITSGHRLVDIVDLPDGGVFYSKPYDQLVVARSFREMMSA